MKALLAILALVLTLSPAFASDTPTPGPVVGIGTEIKAVSGHPVVTNVVPDSPAYKHGIKPGDRIVSIDSKSVDGLTLEQVAHLLRGASGSHVSVSVERNGKEHSFLIRREIIVLPGSQLPSAP